ncbi:MAG: hypothetical protein ACTSP2_10585 [Alphaproteobacteria bacterium]
MLYALASYWPFILLALIAGLAVGWWYQSPDSVDDVTAWLEKEHDDR